MIALGIKSYLLNPAPAYSFLLLSISFLTEPHSHWPFLHSSSKDPTCLRAFVLAVPWNALQVFAWPALSRHSGLCT